MKTIDRTEIIKHAIKMQHSVGLMMDWNQKATPIPSRFVMKGLEAMY
jgi:hypothetical protein